MQWVTREELDAGIPFGINGKALESAVLPPLDIDASGNLTMEDRMLVNCVIQTGLFINHRVVWPGSKLPMATLPKDTDEELVHLIGWKHLYWLERPRVAASGGGGQMGDEMGSERKRQANVLALRLSDGRFVPHRYSLMRFTMKYAELKNIPLKKSGIACL